MKRTIFFLAFLFILTLSAEGQQSTFSPELTVGGSAGLNFASVAFSPSRVYENKLQGLTFGVVGRWNTEKNLGIQAELNFSQQGWKEKFDGAPEYHYSRTINYIELPFLTHIYFGGKRVKGFLNMGPKIGYALNESTDSNLGDATPNKTNTQHNLALKHNFDWGLCGGPGIELRTRIGIFAVEVRYYYAIGDIFGNSKSDAFSKSSNQVISARIYYLIRIR